MRYENVGPKELAQHQHCLLNIFLFKLSKEHYCEKKNLAYVRTYTYVSASVS